MKLISVDFIGKILLLEFWFFIWLPICGGILHAALGLPGDLLYIFLFASWCWQLFVYVHYRFIRQEEFLYVLQTAVDTQAPVESVLRAYLKDRPDDGLYHGWLIALLSFVFPGYYWIHRQRSFDVRLHQVSAMLHRGASLNEAFRLVPGVVSRETALAVAVGQFSGRLPEALRQLPDRRLKLQWLEMAPRLLYPVGLLAFIMGIVSFVMIFIMPKLEKIFLEFKMHLPYQTELLISCSRWFVKYFWLDLAVDLSALLLFNLVLFSSRVRWYLPIGGGLYRMYARGQFLNVLGLMLQTGKPLPEVLGAVFASGLLPTVIANRVQQLAQYAQHGQPLAESLVQTGLATKSMQGLITTAQKANNLPWALAELGDSLVRRSARLSYRITMGMFPLCVFACALLVGFVAWALFSPLVEIIDGLAS